MSAFVGNDKQFSSGKTTAGGPGRGGLSPRLSSKHLMNPPAPKAYAGLATGPAISIEYEPNITVPVDGSNGIVRSLSPFMLQVEPPLVYNSEWGLYAAQAGSSQKSVTTYSGALNSTPSTGGGSGSLVNANYPGPAVQQVGESRSGYVSTSTGQTTGHLMGDGTAATGQEGQRSGRLGKPAIADRYTAVDIALQIQAAINTPPLVLLINPQSLVTNFNKIQQFGDRSRYGYIFQAWGEEQPTLNITARCGAFMSGGRGLHMASRRDSAAWQNLMNAFTLYRNNGYIHDTVGKSNAHHFVGGISIHYDGWIIYGNMKTFGFGHEETNQLGGVEFSIEFGVSQMLDTSNASNRVLPMRSPVASPSDPRNQSMRTRSRVNQVRGQVPFTENLMNFVRDATQGVPGGLLPSTLRNDPSRGSSGFQTVSEGV